MLINPDGSLAKEHADVVTELSKKVFAKILPPGSVEEAARSNDYPWSK